MFIDQGTPVDVVAGPYAGRFGVVSKIRIFVDESRLIHDVMIFCELFNHESGVFDYLVTEASQLKRRRLTDSQIESAQIDAVRLAA